MTSCGAAGGLEAAVCAFCDGQEAAVCAFAQQHSLELRLRSMVCPVH